MTKDDVLELIRRGGYRVEIREEPSIAVGTIPRGNTPTDRYTVEVINTKHPQPDGGVEQSGLLSATEVSELLFAGAQWTGLPYNKP